MEVPLDGLQAEIYEALRDRYAGIFRLDSRERLRLARMGDVVMYLLEAATNPALLPAGSSNGDPPEFRHPPLDIPPDSDLGRLVADYAQHETPRKFVTLAQLVRANAELSPPRKTLVWSNFVRNLESLRRMLSTYQPAMVHGGVPSEVTEPGAAVSREMEIQRFREDPQCLVLLANPAALSEGISLHDVCHDAIYLDRTFNAGQYLQSVDRIHRLGMDSTQETRIVFLITTGTVDDLVNTRVGAKAALLGDMLDDPDIAQLALPDDDDYGPAIDPGDTADIAALFAHLRAEDASESA
jgi:SNF2 family DNA or RNA helicase